MSVSLASNVPVPSMAGRAALCRQQEEDADDGRPRMTKRVLEAICKDLKLYRTPHLNDKLYLHFKGFTKIENLEAYTGVKALWLESNSIGKIEGLKNMVELRCLYLHQNGIEHIENLEQCQMLTNINLSSNCLRSISNLSCLPNLAQLQLTDNYLESYESIAHLAECKSLTVIDLKNNKLDNPAIVDIFKQLPDLRVLVLSGNPVVKKIKSYRKTLVVEIASLTYIDERPVFDDERRTAAAWLEGGLEAERAERIRIKDEKYNKQMDAIHALAEKRKQWAREGRIARGENPDEETKVADPCVPVLPPTGRANVHDDDDDTEPRVVEVDDDNTREDDVAQIVEAGRESAQAFPEEDDSVAAPTALETTYEAPDMELESLDLDPMEPSWGAQWGLPIPSDHASAPTPTPTPIKGSLHEEMARRAQRSAAARSSTPAATCGGTMMATRELMAQVESKGPLIQMLDRDSDSDSDDE